MYIPLIFSTLMFLSAIRVGMQEYPILYASCAQVGHFDFNMSPKTQELTREWARQASANRHIYTQKLTQKGLQR